MRPPTESSSSGEEVSSDDESFPQSNLATSSRGCPANPERAIENSNLAREDPEPTFPVAESERKARSEVIGERAIWCIGATKFFEQFHRRAISLHADVLFKSITAQFKAVAQIQEISAFVRSVELLRSDECRNRALIVSQRSRYSLAAVDRTERFNRRVIELKVISMWERASQWVKEFAKAVDGRCHRGMSHKSEMDMPAEYALKSSVPVDLHNARNVRWI
jgi:hypothetical protein